MERRELGEILDQYRREGGPLPQEELVAMLREIQDALGCIPQGVRAEAARAAGVKETTVDAIVKLYPSLKAAAYRHQITVCQGRNCGPKGGNSVWREVCDLLQPDRDGISADGQFLVRTVACMKRCRTAPNVEIDGVVYPAVQAGEVKRRIEELMEKEV